MMMLAGLEYKRSGLLFDGQEFKLVKQRRKVLWPDSQQAKYFKAEFRQMVRFRVEVERICVGEWI